MSSSTRVMIPIRASVPSISAVRSRAGPVRVAERKARAVPEVSATCLTKARRDRGTARTYSSMRRAMASGRLERRPGAGRSAVVRAIRSTA